MFISGREAYSFYELSALVSIILDQKFTFSVSLGKELTPLEPTSGSNSLNRPPGELVHYFSWGAAADGLRAKRIGQFA